MSDCAICLQLLGRDLSALGCGHVFHTECIAKWFAQQRLRTCPHCKAVAQPTQRLHQSSNSSNSLNPILVAPHDYFVKLQYEPQLAIDRHVDRCEAKQQMARRQNAKQLRLQHRQQNNPLIRAEQQNTPPPPPPPDDDTNDVIIQESSSNHTLAPTNSDASRLDALLSVDSPFLLRLQIQRLIEASETRQIELNAQKAKVMKLKTEIDACNRRIIETIQNKERFKARYHAQLSKLEPLQQTLVEKERSLVKTRQHLLSCHNHYFALRLLNAYMREMQIVTPAHNSHTQQQQQQHNRLPFNSSNSNSGNSAIHPKVDIYDVCCELANESNYLSNQMQLKSDEKTRMHKFAVVAVIKWLQRQQSQLQGNDTETKSTSAAGASATNSSHSNSLATSSNTAGKSLSALRGQVTQLSDELRSGNSKLGQRREKLQMLDEELTDMQNQIAQLEERKAARHRAKRRAEKQQAKV